MLRDVTVTLGGLREWYQASPRSWVWLAEEAKVSVRTVKRIAAGYRASGRTAMAIHEATAVPIEVLLRGVK